jgi:drug/metabolite transporter (DMT)-like permease
MNLLKKLKSGSWLIFAIITTVFWGIWGAFIEVPEKAGFPATLGYVIWSLTMIPCALVALYNINWKIDAHRKSIFLGCAAGFTGAAGQIILFQALRTGPAYLVFPFVSLSPIVTIFLSNLLLKEKASKKQWIGIILALIAIFLFSYQPSDGSSYEGISWLILAVLVFVLWGVQAYVLKFANESMKAESIFFYMAITALFLSPFALYMTDWSQDINWGWNGPYLAASIQILNAIGALTLVYAFRYGKAMVVAPLTGLSPIITVGISLALYAIIPSSWVLAGVVIAFIAIYLLSE